LALLLNSVNCVGQPVLLRVALRLDFRSLLLLRVIFVFLGRLSLTLRNSLKDSLRISCKGDTVKSIGIVSVILVEGGEFGEDELVCAV
jgi:hypothetical protein